MCKHNRLLVTKGWIERYSVEWDRRECLDCSKVVIWYKEKQGEIVISNQLIDVTPSNGLFDERGY